MTKLLGFVAVLLTALISQSQAAYLTDADFPSLVTITARGGTMRDLLNDSKLFSPELGEQISTAINNGDLANFNAATFKDSGFKVQNAVDATKLFKLDLSGESTGITQTFKFANTTNSSITFPATAADFVTLRSDVATLANKSIDAGLNTITNITDSSIASPGIANINRSKLATSVTSAAIVDDANGNLSSVSARRLGDVFYTNDGVTWTSTSLPQAGKFVVYVDPNGNNATCAINRIDLPCADPAQAMSIITNSDANHMYSIVMYPGTYTVATLALKAYVSLVGLSGSYQTSGTWLQVTGGNITLDASLAGVSSVNLIKGFQLIATGLNFDVAALGAGHTHIFTVDSMHGSNAVTFKAASTSDTFNMSNSLFSNGNLLCSGGFVNLNAGTVFYANATFDTATGVNSTHYLQQVAIYGVATFASSGGKTMFGVIYSSSLGTGLVVSGASTSVYPDEISVPLKSTVSFNTGAVDITNLIRQSDVYGAAYSATTAADWNTTPNTGQGALDLIGNRGVVKSQAANQILASPNGSAGLMSPRSFQNADLPASGAISGTYTSSNITVNAKGIITGISSGSGAGTLNITTTSTNATLANSNDVVIINTTNSAIALTLQSSASATTKPYYIVVDGNYPVTITASGGDTFLGMSSQTLAPDQAGVILIPSGGTKWYAF